MAEQSRYVLGFRIHTLYPDSPVHHLHDTMLQHKFTYYPI